jgi:DNA-binding transcriptional MerR regulator
MSTYSIADLEKLSGIKSHTIRIWEKRYDLLIPKRTLTNIRCYDDEQLRKILNVSLLIENGLKISKIAKLNSDEINKKIDGISTSNLGYKSIINKLILDSLEFNESNFEELISELILKIGFSETYKNILIPLLNKLGVLWTIGDIYPANEHFLSNLINKKMYASIDSVNTDLSLNKKVLLFTPPWEDHNFCLLYAEYIFRKSGYSTINIGQAISINSLRACIKKINPDIICTSLIVGHKEVKMQQFVDELWEIKRNSKILIGGNINLLKLIRTNANKYYDIESFEQAIQIG